MLDVFGHHRSRGRFSSWVEKDFKLMFPDFSDNLVKTDEIVYQKLEHFQNYKDKTLLIVGGGPSASTGWEDVEYDYLWTMNHFYENPIFNNKEVDLAMIMGEPDIENPLFTSLRDRCSTRIGFEVHDRWENYSFDKYENYFCMHTRFYGRIGIGARMKIFASHLGFKRVYFTGCDGPEAIFAGDHFFEPGKTTLPSVFSRMKLNDVSYYWKKQYDYLWDYIKVLNPHIEFINLGGGELYHEKCK